jgi:acetylcholinesterase
MAFALTTLFGLLQLQIVHAVSSFDVNTTSGPVQGFINRTNPNVAQFLGIPFAEPPTGARRWLPAVRKAREYKMIDATRFGPSCPQWQTDVQLDFPNFTPTPLDYQSEDCLSLNVWAPYQEKKDEHHAKKSLPVLLWLYGGGYSTGSGNVPYQNPAPWVQKSRKHVVVSIK